MCHICCIIAGDSLLEGEKDCTKLFACMHFQEYWSSGFKDHIDNPEGWLSSYVFEYGVRVSNK